VVPWNEVDNADTVFLGEPNVDLESQPTVNGRTLTWRQNLTDDLNGRVDLTQVYGPLAKSAAYGYAEVELDEAQDLLLKLGSNDGYLCWFNGELVGRLDGGRSYSPDQDSLEVAGKAGTNTIVVTILQMGFRWSFGVRLTDRDGQPIVVKQSTR